MTGPVNNVISRRDLLQLGGAGLAALTLPTLLRAQADAAQQGQSAARARNVIFIWQQGGPPHQDTWDMKPTAPADMRGEFNPVSTSIPGYTVCELLPRLAQMVHDFTILRGVNHNIADHNPGSMYMLGSGNPPNPVMLHPTWSAVAAREFTAVAGIPTCVAVPREPSEGPGAGFLGPAYQSFATQADPFEENFAVRALSLPQSLSLARFDRRHSLLQSTDNFFDELTDRPDVLQGLDQFHQQAHQMILAPATREAFEIHKEPAALRDRYGRTKLGQRLLLSRRLIEAGVRFVTISEPTGWDTHAQNFQRMREQLPVVDQSFSALVEDLQVRGLYDDTLVMMFGEFGRTPRINQQAGRDHWPQAMSIVLAGGGTPRGLIHGATDQNGAFVTQHSHSPADFACTIYALLGIDPHRHYLAPNGQPTPIVRGGSPITAVVN